MDENVLAFDRIQAFSSKFSTSVTPLVLIIFVKHHFLYRVTFLYDLIMKLLQFLSIHVLFCIIVNKILQCT